MNKIEAIKLVSESGALEFIDWYKNTFTYSNDKYSVTGEPDYRDNLGSVGDIYELSELEHFTIYCKETGDFIYSE